MANVFERADAQLSAILSEWSMVTTIIAAIIVGFIIYPIVYSEEPDTHPLLLARQSSINPVRNKNESALYRSPEVPHGYPLKTGLNVKDPGAPRWQSGKDGDLRDVWREVQKGGSVGADGKEIPRGLIMTVFGKEDLVEHDIKDLGKEIQIMGQHLRESGCKSVAIYLSNSIEFLMAVFGTSFSLSDRSVGKLTLTYLQHVRSTAFRPSYYHTTNRTQRSSNSSMPPLQTLLYAQRAIFR